MADRAADARVKQHRMNTFGEAVVTERRKGVIILKPIFLFDSDVRVCVFAVVLVKTRSPRGRERCSSDKAASVSPWRGGRRRRAARSSHLRTRGRPRIPPFVNVFSIIAGARYAVEVAAHPRSVHGLARLT